MAENYDNVTDAQNSKPYLEKGISAYGIKIKRFEVFQQQW